MEQFFISRASALSQLLRQMEDLRNRAGGSDSSQIAGLQSLIYGVRAGRVDSWDEGKKRYVVRD